MKIATPYLPLLFALMLCVVACSSGPSTDGLIDDEQTTPSVSFSERYNADRSFYSAKLGEQIYYSFYLPNGSGESYGESYGVVFLLHGWGCDNNSWGPDELDIASIVEPLEESGEIDEFIYVIPQGFNTYYCNYYDNSYYYMDMLIEEFIPFIDGYLPTTATASERAVAGFSMGGFGALTLAAQHPDHFAAAVGLSPSLNSDDQYTTLSQDGWDLQWGTIFGGSGSYGSSRLTSYYLSQSPLHIFADNPASTFDGVGFFIDCGDDEERLYEGNSELHTIMRDSGVEHEYRVRNGAHTYTYWTQAMAEALPYISTIFNGESYPAETLTPLGVEPTSTKSSVTLSDLQIDIYLPSHYDSEQEYTPLYYSQGPSEQSLSGEEVALALDSLMSIKNIYIASFSTQEAIDCEIELSQIVEIVEEQITSKGAKRAVLHYGAQGDYILNTTLGSDPLIPSLFVVDGEMELPSDTTTSSYYYLSVSDDGTYYREMSTLFCDIRDSSATVQYRVYNGTESLESVKKGIYDMSYYLGNKL